MYCSAEDVKNELYLPILTQINTKYGASVDAFFDVHIRRAYDYINVVLSQAFDVPFDPVPTVVNTITAKLASFYVFARFSEKEELARDKRDAALEMLDALLKSGQIPGEIGTSPSEEARIHVGGAGRFYDDTALRLM